MKHAAPKKPKEPAASIIRKFGGRGPMSRKTGIPASTIQRWEESGYVSPKRYPELYDAAERLGIDLSPTDFAPPTASSDGKAA